jgi:hypothetical protein
MRLQFKITFLFSALWLAASALHGQVGIGILNVDPSAVLHLESTDRGLLLPRLTTAQRVAIANPTEGLVVYDVTDSIIYYWNDECWLPVFVENCDDCYFTASLSATSGTINQITTDSVTFTINVNQTFGTSQPIGINVAGFTPVGFTWSTNPNPIPGGGSSSQMTFKVTPWTPAGTYPIVVQLFCGSTVKNIIYTLTVDPCYLVNYFNTANNVNVFNDYVAQNPGAPTNQPVCILVRVHPGVTITSTNSANPAMNEGGIPAGSIVGIYNEGFVIGRGGNGGTAYNPANGQTGAGQNGGDAIRLTAKTYLINNNGYVFGGGGGGGSAAFALSWTFNVPVIGNITFGFLIGSGGGGGAGGGQGGQTPGAFVGPVWYEPGQNGSSGQFGQPGIGGFLNYPITWTVSVVSISIDPNAIGGNGGVYGGPGTQGVLQVLLTASAVVNIPFIGTITIPLITNLAIPLPVPLPPPGLGGYAIRRNGSLFMSLPDGIYNTSYIRGAIGN